MILQLFYYFGITIVLISVFFLSGSYLFYSIHQRSTNNHFIALMIGTTASIIAYGIWITGFKTINVLGLVLIISYTFYYRTRVNQNINLLKSFQISFKLITIYHYFSILAILFFINTVFIINPLNLSFEGGFVDTYIYANFSKYLNLGQENTLCEANYLSESSSLNVYHYFELWLTALIVKIFGISSYVSMQLVAYTAMQFMMFTAFYSLLKRTPRLLDILFSFLLLFSFFFLRVLSSKIPQISFIDKALSSQLGCAVNYMQWFHLKGVILFCFLFLLLTLIKRKEYTKGMFVSLSLTLLNPTTGIVFSLTYGLVLTIILKTKVWKHILYMAGYGVIFGAYILIFSSFGDDDKNSISSAFYLNYINNQLLIAAIAIIIPIIWNIVLFIILTYKSSTVKTKEYLTIFLFLGISAVIGVILNLKVIHYDSKQFWSYNFIPASTALASLIYLELWNRRIKTISILVIVILLTSFTLGMYKRHTIVNFSGVTKYDQQYQKKVLDNLSDTTTVFSASIFNDKYYNNIHSTKNYYKQRGEFVNFYRNNLVSFTITDYKAEKVFPSLGIYSSSAYKGFNKRAYFNNFILKSNDSTKSIGEHQKAFITKNKISCLFVESNTNLEPEIKSITTLIAEDPLSGERFYKIKFEK